MEMWGVSVVAGSRLGPCSVNEGSGLCGWLEGGSWDRHCLKIRLLLACQDAFISAFKYPLVKAQRSLTTTKMPGLPEGVTHSSVSAVERIPFKPVSFPCSWSVAATYCHSFPILSHFLSLLYCTSNWWVLPLSPLVDYSLWQHRALVIYLCECHSLTIGFFLFVLATRVPSSFASVSLSKLRSDLATLLKTSP